MLEGLKCLSVNVYENGISATLCDTDWHQIDMIQQIGMKLYTKKFTTYIKIHHDIEVIHSVWCKSIALVIIAS